MWQYVCYDLRQGTSFLKSKQQFTSTLKLIVVQQWKNDQVLWLLKAAEQGRHVLGILYHILTMRYGQNHIQKQISDKMRINTFPYYSCPSSRPDMNDQTKRRYFWTRFPRSSAITMANTQISLPINAYFSSFPSPSTCEIGLLKFFVIQNILIVPNILQNSAFSSFLVFECVSSFCHFLKNHICCNTITCQAINVFGNPVRCGTVVSQKYNWKFP